MKTRTYRVVDKSGLKHELILENSVGRSYDAWLDGVKVHFIAQCLSFDAAFHEYCTRDDMKPTSCDIPQAKNKTDTAFIRQGIQRPSGHSPADCLTTLEFLHDLFRKEIISKEELNTRKTKILSYFSENF